MSVFYIGTLYIEETHLKKIKGINRKKCYWEKSHKFVEKNSKKYLQYIGYCCKLINAVTLIALKREVAA